MKNELWVEAHAQLALDKIEHMLRFGTRFNGVASERGEVLIAPPEAVARGLVLKGRTFDGVTRGQVNVLFQRLTENFFIWLDHNRLKLSAEDNAKVYYFTMGDLTRPDYGFSVSGGGASVGGGGGGGGGGAFGDSTSGSTVDNGASDLGDSTGYTEVQADKIAQRQLRISFAVLVLASLAEHVVHAPERMAHLLLKCAVGNHEREAGGGGAVIAPQNDDDVMPGYIPDFVFRPFEIHAGLIGIHETAEGANFDDLNAYGLAAGPCVAVF